MLVKKSKGAPYYGSQLERDHGSDQAGDCPAFLGAVVTYTRHQPGTLARIVPHTFGCKPLAAKRRLVYNMSIRSDNPRQQLRRRGEARIAGEIVVIRATVNPNTKPL